MNSPRNYQSSDYSKQATEFQKQHGDMGTPEHIFHATCPDRDFGIQVKGFRTAEDFDSKFGGQPCH